MSNRFNTTSRRRRRRRRRRRSAHHLLIGVTIASVMSFSFQRHEFGRGGGGLAGGLVFVLALSPRSHPERSTPSKRLFQKTMHSQRINNNPSAFASRGTSSWPLSSSTPSNGENQNSNGNGNGNNTAKESNAKKWANLRVLGKLTVAIVLAYGYLQYWVWSTFASLGYFVYQKKIRHKEGPKGAWLGVGMIFLILSLLPKILEPAKVLIQVVVTFFFSTLFVMLAHSDIEERS